MHITLSPIRSDAELTLHRAGNVLTIGGVPHDFSALPEGAVLPRAEAGCPWLASDIRRQGGRLHLTLLLPHAAEAPPETLFPAPLTDPADGPVPLPPHGLAPPQ